MTQFATIRVVQGSDADVFLNRTQYDLRNIRFDGTVSYSYTESNQGTVGACEDCGRLTYIGTWEGLTMMGMAELELCEDCGYIREQEA